MKTQLDKVYKIKKLDGAKDAKFKDLSFEKKIHRNRAINKEMPMDISILLYKSHISHWNL